MRTAVALIGGALLGAGAALLFAPQTGRATRAKLRDKSNKYGHEVQNFVQKKSRHLRNKMQGYRHQAEKIVEHGQERMAEGMEKARGMASGVMGRGETGHASDVGVG